MFVIRLTDAAQVLAKFDLSSEKLSGFDLLANYQQADSTCVVLCAYFDGCPQKYVIKLIQDERSTIEEINRQSGFSEFLRLSGIPVPRKYKSNGNFCAAVSPDNVPFLAAVEDYFGKDLRFADAESAEFLGANLGRIHTLSSSANMRIGEGAMCRAVTSLSTTFDKVMKFEECPLTIKDRQYIETKHNTLLWEIRKIWSALPIAAVHGDLGLLSNLVKNAKGLGIIDFNLAGDEALLGDFLVTWYSSRYEVEFIQSHTVAEIKKIRKAFFDSYLSEYKPSNIEKNAFAEISRFLNGVYFAKYISNLYEQGFKEKAADLAGKISENYDKYDCMF